MNIKTLGLKLAGGLLAAAFVVTALAGKTNPAAADLSSCPGLCSVDTRPDLVAKFDVTVLRDGTLKVVNQTKNAGLSDTGSFRYRFLVNGQQVVDAGGSLAAGGTLGETFWFYGFCKSAGTVTIEEVVDYDNQVNESNEGNNKAQKTVSC